MNNLTVSWFSAGVSSAVATKLAIDKIDRIFYIHIDDQHEDSMRFVKDCEQWFGKKIEILQSDVKTVEEACLAAGGRGYLSGPSGAACTGVLKRVVRLKWELVQERPLTYIWGMDYSNREMERADRLIKNFPNQQHEFPLIDEKLTKTHTHEILRASGIQRPKMYELGFHNNNCIACAKAASIGYWYLTRKHFPQQFAARARLERTIGASCRKKKVDGETVRLWLDELGPEEGKGLSPIVDDCGILCQVLEIQ